jgi:hypothetical protein
MRLFPLSWRLYQDSNDTGKTVEVRRNSDGTFDLNLYEIDKDGNADMTDWILNMPHEDESVDPWQNMVNLADAHFDTALEEDPIDGDPTSMRELEGGGR